MNNQSVFVTKYIGTTRKMRTKAVSKGEVDKIVKGLFAGNKVAAPLDTNDGEDFVLAEIVYAGEYAAPWNYDCDACGITIKQSQILCKISEIKTNEVHGNRWTFQGTMLICAGCLAVAKLSGNIKVTSNTSNRSRP